MHKSNAFLFLTFFIASVAYAQTIHDSNDVLQAFIAAISGAILTSSSIFILIRRVIGQYDAKHDEHDKEILHLKNNIHAVENNFKKNFEDSTNLIVESINSLKDDIREIITDVAILKDDRRRCVSINDRIDSNAGDLKVLEVQVDSLMSALARLEKQLDKQITRK